MDVFCRPDRRHIIKRVLQQDESLLRQHPHWPSLYRTDNHQQTETNINDFIAILENIGGYKYKSDYIDDVTDSILFLVDITLQKHRLPGSTVSDAGRDRLAKEICDCVEALLDWPPNTPDVVLRYGSPFTDQPTQQNSLPNVLFHPRATAEETSPATHHQGK